MVGEGKAVDVGGAAGRDQHLIGVDRNILAVARDGL